jgi:hypothetical protein
LHEELRVRHEQKSRVEILPSIEHDVVGRLLLRAKHEEAVVEISRCEASRLACASVRARRLENPEKAIRRIPRGEVRAMGKLTKHCADAVGDLERTRASQNPSEVALGGDSAVCCIHRLRWRRALGHG